MQMIKNRITDKGTWLIQKFVNRESFTNYGRFIGFREDKVKYWCEILTHINWG